jgi:hypothetical protein
MTPLQQEKYLLNVPYVYIIDESCPLCGCVLFIKSVDQVWCINARCFYGRLHLIGDGTKHIPVIARLTRHKAL